MNKRSVKGTHLIKAVRALNHLYSVKTKGWEIYANMDSQFDGGEYSNGFWSDNFEKAMEEATAIVSRRFGISVRELSCAQYEMNYNFDCQRQTSANV